MRGLDATDCDETGYLSWNILLAIPASRTHTTRLAQPQATPLVCSDLISTYHLDYTPTMPNFVLWLALVTLILASAIHGYPSEVTYEIVEEITSPPTETTHEVISSPTDITSPPADQVTSSPPTESCAQILEMGDPTKEQWKSTLGPWVAEKLQEYKQENEHDDTPGFFRWLTDSYTPGYSSCDDLQNCEVST